MHLDNLACNWVIRVALALALPCLLTACGGGGGGASDPFGGSLLVPLFVAPGDQAYVLEEGGEAAVLDPLAPLLVPLLIDQHPH